MSHVPITFGECQDVSSSSHFDEVTTRKRCSLINVAATWILAVLAVARIYNNYVTYVNNVDLFIFEHMVSFPCDYFFLIKGRCLKLEYILFICGKDFYVFVSYSFKLSKIFLEFILRLKR